jgi:hypothetical protein
VGTTDCLLQQSRVYDGTWACWLLSALGCRSTLLLRLPRGLLDGFPLLRGGSLLLHLLPLLRGYCACQTRDFLLMSLHHVFLLCWEGAASFYSVVVSARMGGDRQRLQSRR